MSVRCLLYNWLDNFIMRYNELSYHKASPFYKQDFLPDIAWLNRKPKQFPSQIPTGKDYFPLEAGRRHYNQRFNHSQIEATGVLTSPQKYPFQNRIAHEKSYMRNLDTTDIEGAGSGTRVNEAVRYKLRAQEELARRYNQSLDMRENKEHQYQSKRRQLATKNYQKVQEKKKRQPTDGQNMENSRLSQDPQKNRQDDGRYIEYPGYPRNSNPDALNGQKYVTLQPKPYYNNLQNSNRQPQYTQKYKEPLPQSTLPCQYQPAAYQPLYQPPSQKPQYQPTSYKPQYQPASNQPQYQPQYSPLQPTNPRSELSNSTRGQQHAFNANDRHKSNPDYVNNYDNEWNRRRQDYARTIEIDNQARQKLLDKREFRKYNPTNLSFNLAGQSIVSGKH